MQWTQFLRLIYSTASEKSCANALIFARHATRALRFVLQHTFVPRSRSTDANERFAMFVNAYIFTVLLTTCSCENMAQLLYVLVPRTRAGCSTFSASTVERGIYNVEASTTANISVGDRRVRTRRSGQPPARTR